MSLINLLQKMPSRDKQYATLVQKLGVGEDSNSGAIFEAIESIFQIKGENAAQLESLLSDVHLD